jgi:hypothetical protein
VPAGFDEASAGECGAEIIADLVGSGDVAEISATGQAGCDKEIRAVACAPAPYFTYEIACSSDRRSAAEGLCSTTPCPDLGGSLRFELFIGPMGVVGRRGSRASPLTRLWPLPA